MVGLFGFGDEQARFGLSGSTEPPSAAYTVALVGAIVALALAPYVEELVRGLRGRRSKVAIPDAPRNDHSVKT